ncbi:MAG: tetratricopeptide repeat protein [Deltaproteobacteria bacterium]|nr:tetratricopeptide repeat protein [Deltaproteobacteria bacterium]
MKSRLMVSVLACLLLCSCMGGAAPVQKARHLSDSARQNVAGLEQYQRGCWKRALENFFHAHELAVAGDQAHETATALNNIGNAYRMLGEAESAAGFFSEAAGIFRDAKDPEGERQALCNRAAALIALSRFDEAGKSLEAAEAVKVEGGSVFIPLAVNRAVLSLKKKDYAEAERLFNAALATEAGAKSAGVRHGMGVLLLETGRPADAAAHFEAALDLDRAGGFAVGMADDLNRLGAALLGAGKKADAAKTWKRALLIYSLTGRKEDAAKVREQLVPLAAETGLDLDVTELFRERWLGGGAYETPCGK